ncbi:putative winged helix-turn-helix DNA-binding domain, thioredoxin-like protein [Lupinus albus]|uniref:Putative winged helix-turn-helix DNA-binding domain, thioredoxin-like protein n=1 Tax=Lupinus albus TaxID=3870 RepID=A0A6A4PQT7_LUPAL|nr:putative winged helix-turn-helix DNA-binding domain, thioredoxin-like protein [Lupinus albus]
MLMASWKQFLMLKAILLHKSIPVLRWMLVEILSLKRKKPLETRNQSTWIKMQMKLDSDQETPLVVEKAVALKNLVKEKSLVAVSTVLRRLSGKSDEGAVSNFDDEGNVSGFSKDSEPNAAASEKSGEKFDWNPLNYIKKLSDVDLENKTEWRDSLTRAPPTPIAMKGRIILYTKLGCQESKNIRQFLYMKRLRYVEINIDVYPGRKMELGNISGSTSVPKVYFNEILIGGLSELKTLDESGKLDEKIDFVITETPIFEAPSPPFPGEDEESSSGELDEMALVVLKLKASIAVKDRFYKMRMFTNCFLASEAVDFLSEDQYLERPEAVEFAQMLASKFFFNHVLDENLFEDGNHIYRFLDDDPIVVSQCHNILRGIITVKPKRITEIASRLRFLTSALFEAYVSEDGRHVDYTSLHRTGALERRKLFGEFRYVIGGSTYSLSAIQNGILRGNQRPPYNLKKPFGANKGNVALPYPEPLIHFALVSGTRSGPALRCYSPKTIDEELIHAARNFLRSGGVVIDLTAKTAQASKILKWYSADFGKSEVEILKHVSNYLDPAYSEKLLILLATSDLKVTYQPYDWGLNN